MRFDCCPEPSPVITNYADHPKTWNVECGNCHEIILFLVAPDVTAKLVQCHDCRQWFRDIEDHVRDSVTVKAVDDS